MAVAHRVRQDVAQRGRDQVVQRRRLLRQGQAEQLLAQRIGHRLPDRLRRERGEVVGDAVHERVRGAAERRQLVLARSARVRSAHTTAGYAPIRRGEPIQRSGRNPARSDSALTGTSRIAGPTVRLDTAAGNACGSIRAMDHRAWERVPIDAQSVEAPLSRAAVFLVMAAGEGDGAGPHPRRARRGRRPRQERRLPRPGRAAVVRGRHRVRVVGSPVARPPAGRSAPVRAGPRTGARRAVDAGRPALPHPRRARGHDVRARAPAARRDRRRRARGRRDGRLPLLRRARPARLRRRHRQPDRRASCPTRP